MKRIAVSALLILSTLILFVACSSEDSSEQTKSTMDTSSSESSNEIATDSDMDSSATEAKDSVAEESEEALTNQMIVHKANLHVNVKNLETAQLNIEKKVTEYGGYIVEENVYRENEEQVSGYMTVRIPEKHFQQFLLDAEGEAADVLERNVTGQDVTEEYTDLESRVKSKRAVEARLLEFMESAEKTEDLLKISSDLAEIQEEIELIVGKMNYLENQTSYSTIDISMNENSVIVPGLDGKKLDTWEKTKKQLATSTNFLIAAGSGVIVFLIGNVPVIFLLFLVGAAVYFYIKRKRNTKN